MIGRIDIQRFEQRSHVIIMRDLSPVVVEELQQAVGCLNSAPNGRQKTLVSVGSQSEGAQIEAEMEQRSKLASFRHARAFESEGSSVNNKWP
jgi:hypothetical protein